MSEANSQRMQPIRILLVEDHALTRVGIRTVLKRESDIEVVGEAANGQDAVAQAEALKPDVILMDVGMPVMDGIEASRKIIEHGNTAKIIMLTQHDNEQDILASFSAGASGYCLKDVDETRLYTAIRTVYAGDAWLDSSIASKVLKVHGQMSRRTEENADETTLTSELVSSNERKSAISQAPETGDRDKIVESKQAQTHDAEKSVELDRPYAEPLSPRELEVLALIVDGLSNQDISDKLFISLPTTKTHVRNILNKLAVDGRTQAAVHAMKRGLV